MDKELKQIMQQIKCVISDVDGVLTTGQIFINPDGQESKIFHVHDGLAIKLLMQAGLDFAIITAKSSEALTHRMQHLGVEHVHHGKNQKLPAFEELIQTLGLEPSQVAYVGDDWPDLPVMRRVALPIAVANAMPEVKACAKYVTELKGGEGALREVARMILQAQGLHEKVLSKFVTE